MKILFLISDGFGIGGTIRTTFNLAEALAGRGHDVEVLSSFRRRDVPQLPLDPAVRLTSLVEVRPDHPDHDAADPRRGRPPAVYPRADFRAGDYDLMVERRAAGYLRDHDADVVIATRPGLIAWIARFTGARAIRIGQEHLTREMHPARLRTAMSRHYRKLDALVTVSARDADHYRDELRLPHTRTLFIPNSVPPARVAPSDGDRPLIVAAGRLVPSKRYDVLIRAFAKVVAEHPDWQLRIYGTGETLGDLRELVVDLGLHNHVLMMGGHAPMEAEWAKGSVAAVPSDVEPFGMTLVEAMRCGVPVVSTDAPYGPGEILTDGVDGLLTEVGNPDAFADALLKLIADPRRRRTMAAAARLAASRYDPTAIALRYEELFAEIAAGRSGPPRRSLTHLWQTVRHAVPVLQPLPQATAPAADCLVTADGAVDVRLSPDAAGGVLLWQRAAGERDGVPVPAPAPGAAVIDVRLPGDLAEGDWELQLADAQGRRRPLLAGNRDTRTLLDLGEDPAGGVTVRLPYRRPDGQLAVRVWRRPVHPEVGDVQVDGGHLRFAGRLLGAGFGTDAPEVEFRCRGDRARVERVTAHRCGPDGFRVTVAAGLLAAHRVTDHDLWDAWLCHADEGVPVRLGRLLDDVHDKRAAYTFGSAVVESAHGPARVQPYYTMQNEFSVRVVAQ